MSSTLVAELRHVLEVLKKMVEESECSSKNALNAYSVELYRGRYEAFKKCISLINEIICD